MTETRPEPGIDPRFDPRYQRGYVPDAAETREQAPAPGPAAPPAPPTRVPRVPRVAPEDLPRPAPPAGREDDPVPDRGAGAVGDVDAADREDLLPVFDEVDDEPSPADPWFLAAWAVAVLAVVIGGAFWWAGMMAENPFSGVNQSDRWLQYVGWVVAPPLVEGGLIGIVAMLVWTGIRRARRQRGPS